MTNLYFPISDKNFCARVDKKDKNLIRRPLLTPLLFAETPTLFTIIGYLKCLFFSYIFVCAETSTLSPLHFAPNVIFGHCILPRMHFFCMYFAETPILFSIVGCLKCLFSLIFFQINDFVFLCILPKLFKPFLHCILPQMQFFSILPRMHFLVCVLPKPLRFLYCIFAQNVIFGHCILPRLLFLYVFCRNLYAFSIAFCPKCNFWPLYFAQNAFFLYVFCRNPYSFLHFRLPQMPFFLLYFSK